MSRAFTALAALVLAVSSTVACSPAPPASGPAASPVPAQPVATAAATTAAAAAVAAAATSPAPRAPVEVKVASQQLTGNAGIYIAHDRGHFKEQGLDVRLVDVGLQSEMVPPLATGQVEVVGVGLISGTFNAIARDIPIRLVADSGAVTPDPGNGFSSAATFMVAPDTLATGRIRDFSDLKGKTYGGTTAGGGSTAQIVLDRGLRSAGLTPADVDGRPVAFADMAAAIANHVVDFGLGVEPFVAQGEARGLWVRWKGFPEIYPGAQLAALLYGPTMVALGQDVGNRFMVGYTRALRDYYEAFGPKWQNRAEIVSILVQNTIVKDPSLYDRMSWNYLNPDCSLNLEAIASDLEWYTAQGLVPPLRVEQVVNNSYCEAAVQQLGKYQGP